VGVELEIESQLPGEVLDRTDVAEGLGQATLEEPLERIALNRDQIGQRQNLIKAGEREALTNSRTRGQGLLLAGLRGVRARWDTQNAQKGERGRHGNRSA
jgi:hypothetical protein